MSADNGYTVQPCYQDPTHQHGIFYYSASQDYDKSDYAVEKAEESFLSAISAILYAHELNDKDPTEYGVHVSVQTLYSARQETR